MATNPRMYWPIQVVAFAPLGTTILSTGYRAAKGVQSVGHSTNFTLDPQYQLGQLEIYENIEDRPDVEITIDKAIDGYALIEHLATPQAAASTLAGRYNDQRAMCAIAFYNIANSYATGIPLSIVEFSGTYVSSINWSIPVEGSTIESVTLVCNNKVWYTAPSGEIFNLATRFEEAETPVAGGSGGISRRENVNMATSLWPTDIPGISGNGGNPTLAGGQFGAHIQNVTISTSLARNDLLELGRKGPYHRYATFPTEVTTAIEVTATEFGDEVNALEEAENLTDQTIIIRLNQGITIDLGTKNKLASVNSTGGDTGGSNVTVTYNYSNNNSLKVLSPHNDPAGQAS
jgi:hypothetical protein